MEDGRATTQRQRQKAKTRTRILEVARNLFEQQGFDGTTMRAVAASADIAIGTIFVHFPDKGALLIAALLEDLADTDRHILETMPTSPVRDQLVHMATLGFGYWCRRPALSKTLLREMYHIEGEPAGHRREEIARFIGFCRELLAQARDRGELRSDVDCSSVAESLYSFYVGRLIRAAGDGVFDQQQMLADTEAFADLLLNGIATPTR